MRVFAFVSADGQAEDNEQGGQVASLSFYVLVRPLPKKFQTVKSASVIGR